MVGRFRCSIAAAWLAAILPAPAFAAELLQLQTDDLQLVWFHPTVDYLAPHVARSFENSMDFQKRVLGWRPDGKVNVLLKDFGDYGNAGARSSPNNALIVDIAPLSFAFETFVASERMFSLMNHELIHVATLDQWTEQERFWRGAFGGKVQINADHPETLLYHYLTVPRVVVPRWYMEGSAVFFETWMNGGLGRAQGAYDEMVFRAMVRDGAHFYDPLGLAAEGTKVDFQVGVNNYLYGTRFFSYLGHRYSPQHVVRWVARTEGSERYYTDQFEKVFGAPMEAVWQDWIGFEKGFQTKNLAAVRAHPVSAHRRLSAEGLGSISRAYHEPSDDSLIAAFRYPGVAAFIGRLSLRDGKIEPIVDVKGPMLYRVASLAYDPQTQTAFYTADNNSIRDIVQLDVRTGKHKVLFKDARIGDLAFNRADRSLWGLRHLNGIVTLVRIPYPYLEFNQVRSWAYGEVLYDIDLSPDGTLLSTSFAAINGDQSLRVMRTDQLLAGDATPVAQFDFGSAVPDGFVFSPDGRYLYGSSYYTGVSNVFRYELATRKIEALSNAETGFFRPLPLPDGRLVAFDYGGQGFVPGFIDGRPLEDLSAIAFLGAQIAEQHPVVRGWKVPSPGTIDLAARTRSEGEYDSLSEMGLQSFYPVVEGYKDSWAAGLHFNFADPIGLDQLKLTASYSPDELLSPGERVHFQAAYKHRNLHLGFRYNDADFYDLFGPTKRSRRGTAWTVGYDLALVYDKPELLDLKLELEAFNNLDTLPGFQNVAATADELVTAQASLDYSYILNSLGNVDEEKGVRWDLNVVATRVEDRTIPALFARVAAGTPFLFDHSSLWLRTSFGFSDGDDADPFANFFFGAFGNNYVDKRDAKSYRNHFSFPGFEIDEVGGRSYARAMLEWNLPPLRFRSIGTPANYLSWARPALFASVLVANPEHPTLRREVRNLGAQLDLQFYVMHALDMTLSLGYAVGYEDGAADREEFMASLKVLY